MKESTFKWSRIGLRFVQALFLIAALCGAVWQSTLMLRLTIQEFLMLYGLVGAAACEVGVRLLEWKFPETEFEAEEEEPEGEED